MAGGKFGGGTGTTVDPYLIEDADDLNEVRRNLTASFKLVNNINLGIAPYNTGEGWTPIVGSYTGTFDGNAKSILNLYINMPTKDNIGLFAQFDGTIKDLGFISPNVTGKTYVGVFAGNKDSTTNLNRIFIKSGNVNGFTYVGGLIGHLTCSNHYWYDVKIECNVTGTGNSSIGGMFGRFTGTPSVTRYIYLYYSLYSGVVTGTGANAIGIEGSLAGITPLNSYYNSSIATKTSTAATPKTQAQLQLPETYVDWQTRLITGHSNSALNNTNIWTLSNGAFGKMYYEVENRIMILVNGTDYKTWNGTAWVTKYTVQPTREQFLADGMKDISLISYTGWDLLKSETSVEIVNFVDKTTGSNSSTSTESLTIDNASSTANKNIFRKTFSFSDYGDAITKIQGISI